MDVLFSTLENEFGLKDQHVLLIKVLDGQKFNAREICKRTAVPKGRVYGYLNELVAMGLVEKLEGSPILYTVSDLKKNIVLFMKQRIDVLVTSQSKVTSLLGQEQSSSVELIDSSLKFTQAHLKMLEEAKSFRYISVHHSFPYILYPDDEKDFLRIRRIIANARPTITHPEFALLVHRSYHNSLKSGKMITSIFEKASFDYHLSLLSKWLEKKELAQVIEGIINKLKLYAVKVYVLDEYSPLQIDTNERRVCLSLNYVGVTNGIIITSKEAVNFINKVFDEKINRAQDVLPLLESMLKELK